MAEVLPLHALHYNLAAVGSLADVTAPPYDVIAPAERAALTARSPVDGGEADLHGGGGGGDPNEDEGETRGEGTLQGLPPGDRAPSIGALPGEFRGPGGGRRRRHNRKGTGLNSSHRT